MLAVYTFGDVLWSMFVFFLWILWFWLLFSIIGDLFRRHDISGWAKAAWTFFVIILPFLGIFIYLIAEGKGMGERKMAEVQQDRTQMDTYVRSVAASSNPAEQIAKAKELLDSGTISDAEFAQLKAKALVT
ncbi:MAG TPA: SHOCT domain-containing protein [Gaiellaceae bacterium]|nr:SHOCT domain-containing protein [Gaiellaceae bacterium]